MTFSRLNGSMTPDRLMTLRLAVSIVENRPALRALATAADAEAVVARARIDDARIGVTAERAVHQRLRSREAGGDGFAVRGERLGIRQGDDARSTVAALRGRR
jgi:hypothetical protein